MTRAIASAALALLLGGPTPAHPWPVCVERTAPIALGVEVVARSTDDRVVALTLRSQALQREVPVNVLLPRGYDARNATRYPVVYLLHGAGGNAGTWLARDDARALFADVPAIVVMPEGSGADDDGVRRNGGYTDWFGVESGAAGPAFAWESHHVHELIPFVDAHFATRAEAGGRAVLGISMGGTGALKYAAAHPGLFGYAGSLSGGLDSWPFRDVRGQSCVDGDPALQEVVWHDNNPTDLARNLTGIRLFVRSGDGTPGPFDAATEPANPGEALVWRIRLATEAGARVMADNFLRALDPAVARRADTRIYPGSHSAPYWQREAAAFVAWWRVQLRRPVRPPRRFTVTSARARVTAWGWELTPERLVREFSYVRIDRRTVSATGSGRLHVTTPPRFRAGRRYRIQRDDGDAHTITAGTDRRLRFIIDLGPSHTAQQTRFDAEEIATWRSATVRILRGP